MSRNKTFWLGLAFVVIIDIASHILFNNEFNSAADLVLIAFIGTWLSEQEQPK